MMKRHSNFIGAPNKRAKTNQDVEELWGDDLDFDDSVIDDCFTLATQVIENKNVTFTQLNNVSILPSYNAFKGQRNLFCSTQSEPNLQRPTASNFHSQTASSSEAEKLRKMVEMKEGEVSILRSQLRDSKAKFETELEKKQKEMIEKLNVKTREVSAVQSELEFKNLEIINLKQKISEISRVNLSCTQANQSRINDVIKEKTADPKIKPIPEQRYPLLTTIPPTIFKFSHQEKFCIPNNDPQKFTLFHSPISQLVPQKREYLPSQYAKLNLSCIAPEIGVLLNCTASEIEHSNIVNKILNISLSFLHTFLAYLKEVEQNCETEDLIHADVLYLKKNHSSVSDVSVFDEKEMCLNEVGINARRSVALLAELLFYNSSLRNCLLENQTVCLDRSYFIGEPKYDTRYRSIVMECVSLIGRLRKSSDCVGFLCAVTRMMANLSKHCKERSSSFFYLFKEIVFCRPELNTLLEMSVLLNYASQDITFAKQLCNAQSLQLNVKEGFYVYNRDSCLCHVITVLYENHLYDLENNHMLMISENMLCFIRNLLDLNLPSLYCKSNKMCDCLCQFIQLSLELIVRCLNNYRNEKGFESRHMKILFLSVEFLHLINFKMCSLIEKSIIYARFVRIVQRLLEFKEQMQEETVKLLENLILMEDESDEDVTADRFEKIFSW